MSAPSSRDRKSNPSREEAALRSYFPAMKLLPDKQFHSDVAFRQTGEHFAVISENNMISLFDVATCNLVKSIPNRKYQCNKLLFHPDSVRIILNSFNDNDHKARLLNVETDGFDLYYTGPNGQITSMATTDACLFTVSEDERLHVFDVKTAEVITKIDCPRESQVATHPNGKCMVLANTSELSLYDIRNMDQSVCSIHFSPGCKVAPHFGEIGNNLLITGSKYAKLHSLRDLSVIRTFAQLEDEFFTTGACFTADEKYALVGSSDNSILAYDVPHSRKDTPLYEKTVLTGHISPVKGIAVSNRYFNMVSFGEDCLFWAVDIDSFNSLGYKE